MGGYNYRITGKQARRVTVNETKDQLDQICAKILVAAMRGQNAHLFTELSDGSRAWLEMNNFEISDFLGFGVTGWIVSWENAPL